MKKIFAILALAVSTTAMADSVTFETNNIQGVGTTDSTAYRMTYQHVITPKKLDTDYSISQTQSDTASKSISTRIEAGLRYRFPIVGDLNGYVRGGIGEKFSTKGNATYYAFEPGILMPIGPFNARVGFRYRSAVDSKDGDQTHTARVNLSYPLSKDSAIALGYDRMRGDSDQNITRLSYIRSF
jgi:hypothetical protein